MLLAPYHFYHGHANPNFLVSLPLVQWSVPAAGLQLHSRLVAGVATGHIAAQRGKVGMACAVWCTL